MSVLTTILKKPITVALLLSLLVASAVVALRTNGSLETLELTAYDWFIRLAPKAGEPDSRITIIMITEDDIQSQGRWPLTDEVLARALGILLKDRPRAIGLDIFRDIPVPPGKEELEAVFIENPHIIGAMKFGERGVPALPSIRSTDQVGFNDIVVDPGGIVRRGLLFLDDGQEVYYSFSLRLALLYLQAEGIVPQPDAINPQHIRLGNTTIPPFESSNGGYVHADTRGYQFLLDYQASGAPFQSYSFGQLMSSEIRPAAIRDKIVLIGVNAQSVKDFFYTPLSRGLAETQQVSGIVLHGHIMNQLLRFGLDGVSPLSSMGNGQGISWIFLWGISGGLIGFWARSAGRVSIAMLAGLGILFLSAYLAYLNRVWIPLVPPLLSFSVTASIATAYMANQEKKERLLLMQLFSKHVSREIAASIWQQREQFLKGGRPRSQKLPATVFFSDLKGFTSASEKMDPEQLMEWLNTYMESLARQIMEHGGVIDDYAGDGIKANFGVPLPRLTDDEIRKDAVNAVRCSLALEKDIERLNDHWKAKGLPPAGVRVGIFTGPVVAGPVGSSDRLKYTTVGDTVNIAARLESYDREVAGDLPCRILIGESTLQYLENGFRTERIGEVGLKGREGKITVYQVLGEDPGVGKQAQEVKA